MKFNKKLQLEKSHQTWWYLSAFVIYHKMSFSKRGILEASKKQTNYWWVSPSHKITEAETTTLIALNHFMAHIPDSADRDVQYPTTNLEEIMAN